MFVSRQEAMLNRSGLALALVLVAASPLTAQQARADSATVAVVVLDAATNKPVEGAEVRLGDATNGVVTDFMGAVQVNYPRGATIRIAIRHAAYAAIDTTFALGETDWQLMLAAKPSAPRMPVTTVTGQMDVPRPHLEGFHRRMAAGKGKFITPEELAKNHDRKLVDMVIRLGGLVADGGPKGNYRLLARSGPTSMVTPGRDSYDRNVRGVFSQNSDSEGAKPGHCEVHVFLDAAYMPDGLDMASLRAAGFDGVEYYTPANVPPEFKRPGVGCGVLLLWSK